MYLNKCFQSISDLEFIESKKVSGFFSIGNEKENVRFFEHFELDGPIELQLQKIEFYI